MRKYRLLLIALPVLLGLATWFLFFKPVTVKKVVEVPYNLWRTGEQVNNLPAICKWFTPFSADPGLQFTDTGKFKTVASGDYSLALENQSVFNAILRISQKKQSALVAYSVLADSGDIKSSRVELLYKTSLASKLFGGNKLFKLAEQNLEMLKEYMTDTKRFYGYEIQEVKVEDTSFLFSRITVPIADKRKAMVALFDKLIRFATEKAAGYNGTRIFYSMTSGNDITLFAGIGVTNAVNPPAGSEIDYKKMPYGKNMLVTNYQGAFGESRKAFEAMELFKTDHQLSSMAIPYQKFLSEGYDFAEDQVVQLKIFYPVF